MFKYQGKHTDEFGHLKIIYIYADSEQIANTLLLFYQRNPGCKIVAIKEEI